MGIVAILLNMLTELKPIAEMTSKHSSTSESSSTFHAERKLFVMGKAVISECLKLLLEIVRGNAGNQMYIAKSMMIILGHVGVDKSAATGGDIPSLSKRHIPNDAFTVSTYSYVPPIY